MTGFAEYDQYDALGLAELVKKGDVDDVYRWVSGRCVFVSIGGAIGT